MDQAHKQLNAAKALAKAADAEYRAARANKDAVALRSTASQLADASGFPATTTATDSNFKQVIVPANGGSRLTPAELQPQAQSLAGPKQPVDFNGPPASDNGDLRPAMNEPNSVP
jgi:hypothetical protein